MTAEVRRELEALWAGSAKIAVLLWEEEIPAEALEELREGRCADCAGEMQIVNQSAERVLWECRECARQFMDDRAFEGYWRLPKHREQGTGNRE